MRTEEISNGAENLFFVLGKTCLSISEWNEHYIKGENIKNIIIFDVTSQKYYSWQEFKDLQVTSFENIEIDIDIFSRRVLRRLRYKVYLPTENITMKKIKKTKKKIENKYTEEKINEK